MADPCAFCGIAAGEREAHVVYGDDDVIAFLDRRPVFHGHTLVVPRAHHETIADVPTEFLGALYGVVQRVTAAVVSGTDSDGAFVAQNNVVSQSVPHVHVHVVPRRFKDGLKGFFWPRHPYESEDQAVEVAGAIRAALGATS